MSAEADVALRAGVSDSPRSGRAVRLDSLTGLRFFAAFAVLLLHVGEFAAVPAVTRYTLYGQLGVSFFFVLSGFVLVWSSRASDTAGRFYWRRFARIWPLLMVTTIIAIPIFYQGRGIPMDLGAIVLSFVLLQAWFPDSSIYQAGNPAAWSLSCEAFFYAVFPALAPRFARLGNRGLLMAGSAAVVGALIVAVIAQDHLARPDSVWLLYISPIFRLFEFMLGMLVATAIKRGWRPKWSLGTAVLLVVLWVVVLADTKPKLSSGIQAAVQDLYWVVPAVLFMMVIAAAAQRDLDGRPSILRSKILIKFGEWSYALYLVHATLIYFLVQHVGIRPPANSNVFWVVAVAAAAIILAGLLYTLVEHPAEKFLRRRQRQWLAGRESASS